MPKPKFSIIIRFLYAGTLLVTIFLSACGSLPATTNPSASNVDISTLGTGNSLISNARKLVDQAIQRDAEWMIRDSATDFHAASFTELLIIAKQRLDEDNEVEANRIATKVSELALIAIAQSESNSNPIPHYQNQ